jgi:hypothetical protein
MSTYMSTNYGVQTGASLTTLTAAGVYTPSLTNFANLDASTAYACQFLRVNNVVNVSGRVDIDPTTTATSTVLQISLPFASTMIASNQCAGVAFCPTIIAQGASINAGSTKARLQYMSSDTTNQPFYFTFQYQII